MGAVAKAILPWLPALRHQGQTMQWWWIPLEHGRCSCQQTQRCAQLCHSHRMERCRWQMGEGLAVPFSWQTVFSWSCRVPVNVGEDLAHRHSRSWYMGILPSFLSALPSLNNHVCGRGVNEGGRIWGKCEKWVKLSESLSYSPRLIPPVRRGADFGSQPALYVYTIFMQRVIEICSIKLC